MTTLTGTRPPLVFDARNKRSYTKGHPALRVCATGNMHFSQEMVALLGLEFPARVRFVVCDDPERPGKTGYYAMSCSSTDETAMTIRKRKRDGGCDFSLVAFTKVLLKNSPIKPGRKSALFRFYPKPVTIPVPGLAGLQRAYQLVYPQQYDSKDQI